MEVNVMEISKRLLEKAYDELTEHEQRVMRHLIERKHVSRHARAEYEGKATVGQRIADRVAAFGGSWTFITIFGSVLAAWVILNSVILVRGRHAFDPYPYILLNLFLSMLAAIQAPIIMMSQNRQAAKDRIQAAHDYEVNLKAEFEVMSLHEKIDHLLQDRWSDLLAIQQEQTRLLNGLSGDKGKASP